MTCRVVIFDDDLCTIKHEELCVSRLLLSREAEIVAVTTVSTFLAELKKGIDILLLNIEFPQLGIDGVECVHILERKGFDLQVIYLSNNGLLNEKVYETNHLWCLAKPVSQDELELAFIRAESKIRDRVKRISLKCGSSARAIEVASILFVESQLHIVRYHLEDEVIDVRGKLSDAQLLLGGDFIRCHKSYLVNASFIMEMRDSEFVLITGDKVPISQRRRSETKIKYLISLE